MWFVPTYHTLIHSKSLLSDRLLSIVRSAAAMSHLGDTFRTDSSQHAYNHQSNNKQQKFTAKLPTLDPGRKNFKSVLDFPFNEKRVRLLSQQREVQNGCHGIVYWMSRDQRVQDNWAFLFAQKMALEKKIPLHVCFCLVPKFLEATIRHFGFLLKGLEEVEKECRGLGILFHLLVGHAKDRLPEFVAEYDIGAVVSDFCPLRVPTAWVQDVKTRLPDNVPFYQVDAHNIVPCWEASLQQEMGAMTIRGKLHAKLANYFTEFPPVIKHQYQPNNYPQPVDWVSAEASLQVDRTVGAVKWATPGTKAGLAMLDEFIANRMVNYAQSRNTPTMNAQSNISPWLHFGQLSSQRIVLTVNEHRFKQKDSVEWFIEQCVVRKELSDNFCFYNQNYDSLDSTHDWAIETLKKHSEDKREYVYGREELEKAQTHDILWNACQIQLVQDGKIHGYMRMYWAKKILEWTSSPKVALADSIYLNDKYSLDGRDPNGYVGIMWSICGLHDKIFPERSVYGKVRYMSYNGCKGKFDVPAFVKQNQLLKNTQDDRESYKPMSTQRKSTEKADVQPAVNTQRRGQYEITHLGGNSGHSYSTHESDMDVLRPALVKIGNRVYRKTGMLHKEELPYQEEDSYRDEQESLYCDEICDVNTNIEETDRGFQLRLDVPSAYFKYIIGKKGDTKKRLETETRTLIKIPKAGEDGEIVITGGERKGVVSAKTRIEVMVDSARQKIPFTHFISFPIVSDNIKGRFEEFKSDVLLNCTDRGIDGSLFQKPEKMHLTLGTLALMSESEVSRAVKILQDCQHDIVDPILKGMSLTARMSGLEYMNDDPGQVDVLYAKVQSHDGSDKLQMLADRVMERFVSSGLMQSQYDRVKIHATVMNTLYRVRKGANQASTADGRQKYKSRETFDASNILQIFGNHEFGEFRMDALHLSERSATGPDGYYACTAKIQLP